MSSINGVQKTRKIFFNPVFNPQFFFNAVFQNFKILPKISEKIINISLCFNFTTELEELRADDSAP